MGRLRSACDAGDPAACDDLSARYAYGDGVPPDTKLAQAYGSRAWAICASEARAPMACATLFVRHPSIPLDQPAPSHESGSRDPAVVSIILFADGRTKIDEDSLASDDAILEVARRRAGPDTRAVIKADASVSHGRVIHVLDLLKQAGLTKIAFGVTALPAPDGGHP